MTVNGLADPGAVRERLNTEVLADSLLALARFFRPSDGWLAFLFLAMNLWVVIFSVEQAEWVPGMELTSLVIMAMLTGILLYRIPAWAGLMLPIGGVVGLLVIVWQFTSREIADVTVTNVTTRAPLKPRDRVCIPASSSSVVIARAQLRQRHACCQFLEPIQHHMELRLWGLADAGLLRRKDDQYTLTIRRDVEAPVVRKGEKITDGHRLLRAECKRRCGGHTDAA